MNKPYLSFIIPIYNGSLYLRETINSVINQPCKDFELILIDDGSVDDSLVICKEYERECVHIFTQQNIGVSKTRNKGIDLAKGQIIIFVDQDDAIRSNFYTEETKSYIDSKIKQGIDLFVCGAWWGDSRLEKGYFRSIEKFKKGVHIGRNDDISWGNTYTFNMNIYSRNLFFDEYNTSTPVRFFDLPLDVETIFRHISLYAARKVLFTDNLSFCIRRNNDASVSSNWDWLKVYPVKCRAYYDLIDWHKQNFPNDKKAICGANKQFIKMISEMIEENYKSGQDMAELLSSLKKEKYYADMLIIIKEYPKQSLLINDFLKHPESIRSHFKIGFLSQLLSLRWRLYKFLGVFQPPMINLRVKLLS